MIIDYSVTKAFTESIDIEDIGNTCLRCVDDNFNEFYIMTKTESGKTSILKVGPIVPDMNILLSGYGCFYCRTDYKLKSILKEISMFINNPKKTIVSVEEISLQEGLSILPDVQKLF